LTNTEIEASSYDSRNSKAKFVINPDCHDRLTAQIALAQSFRQMTISLNRQQPNKFRYQLEVNDLIFVLIVCL